MTPTDDLTTIRDVGEWLAASPPRELTPHQRAALSLIDDQLPPAVQQEFSDLWRSSESPAVTPALPVPAPAWAVPLGGVPYYSQRDSGQVSQRDRTCFSSSCAMLLETLRPGTLVGPNGDDAYLKVVQRFGDTTNPDAQVKALETYGIKARRIVTADFELLERHIAGGIPVPCGWLHRGPVDSPHGGGHWLIAYGIDGTHLTVHDPWGEPDLVSGATIGSNGRALRFSRQNFGKRWMVEQVAGGGYRYAPGNGWAIVVDSVA
jgi:hypothetical protein